MRNFILGKTFTAGGGDVTTSFDSLPAGSVAIGAMNPDNGIIYPVRVAAEILEANKKGYIGLGRIHEDGGPVILPIYANHFSFAIGRYQRATPFVGGVTMPEAIIPGEDYTIIIVKKGVKFNERNKWTASVVAKDSDTNITIATKLTSLINSNSESSGVSATVSTATITITASKSGVDYTILGADALLGVAATYTTHGNTAYGDASYVKDLADKAAADAGFEYTYMGDVNYLYPNYPLNPLKNADSEDTGFNIITIRFAEPREVKTVDDVVHQIIQIALPAGVNLAALTTILDDLTAHSM